MNYTVEVYLADARFKEGEHLINKRDLENVTLEQASQWGPNLYKKDVSRRYRFEVHETWVTRSSLINGIPVKERYESPWWCSVNPAQALWQERYSLKRS